MTTATIRQTTSIHKPVLVLNRNWQPINVATVARSLVMLWNESAKIVDPVIFDSMTGATGVNSCRIGTNRSSKRYDSGFVFRK